MPVDLGFREYGDGSVRAIVLHDWFCDHSKAAALNTSRLPFYPNGRLVSLGECGHYPMQEQPPLLATLIERFLSVRTAIRSCLTLASGSGVVPGLWPIRK